MQIQDYFLNKQVQLTEAQNQTARYIIDHYEESIFLTASELARKAGVSQATVIRFAQAMGFSGYPAIQKMLRQNFPERLTTVTRLEQTTQHIHSNVDILTKVIQADIRNLSETLRDISTDTFHKAVTDLSNARRIYIVGLRGAHAPALILALYLSFIGKQVETAIPGYGDVWNTLHGMSNEDLLIGISLPRYTRMTVEILEYAKGEGIKVGAITDSLLSPLARSADWVLTVHSKLDSFIESFTAAISLVNALLTALSIQNPEETTRALSDREVLWQKKKIYVLPYADYRIGPKRRGKLRKS
jgi:DNA-binding MurR/RpiR family transcriptional regulator